MSGAGVKNSSWRRALGLRGAVLGAGAATVDTCSGVVIVAGAICSEIVGEGLGGTRLAGIGAVGNIGSVIVGAAALEDRAAVAVTVG